MRTQQTLISSNCHISLLFCQLSINLSDCLISLLFSLLSSEERHGATLARAVRLVGVSSCNRKVAGLIPSQGTYPGCGFGHWSGRLRLLVRAHVGGNQSMFLSLPSSLSKGNEKMSLDEDKKKKRKTWCTHALAKQSSLFSMLQRGSRTEAQRE